MLKYFLIIFFMIFLFSKKSFSIELDNESSFVKNSVTVTSVTEINLNNKVEEIKIQKNNVNNFISQYCGSEILIFCGADKDSLSCLKNSFNLITGDCKTALTKELNVGKKDEFINIHDLKLSKSAKYFGTTNAFNYKISKYKSYEVFEYRGMRFRKGAISARSYSYSDYNGQYIIQSGYPINIFSDKSGIEYNPYWQKGAFFFDEKGNVTIGTLSKDLEYKKHIYLKSGTIVAFNDKRELLKGFVSKSVRIGNCGFLPMMEISDKIIKRCEE